MPDSEPVNPLERLEGEHREPQGARVRFQRELADCDDRLVAIGRRIAAAVVPVTETFLEADTHRAGELVHDDLNVDRQCLELEDACFLLLARQAPVAGDLRRIVGILRSGADLQRSAHLLRHVAESLTWVHPPSMPEELRQTVGQLGGLAAEILGGAVEAWHNHDGLAINDLDARDDQVDLLQKWLLTELYTGTQSVEEAVSLALIARYYERVADHGVEMARQVAYFLTGARVGAPD
jgi:phosphate transport system protein